MKIIDIPNYPEYELHYSDTEQKVFSKKRNKYLKNSLNNCGYYQVVLCNSEGVKSWLLHRLVWYVFNTNIQEGLEVNHINECKTDNRIDNLNLMSHSENINYGTRNQKDAESKSIPIVGINKTTYDIIEFVSSHEAERTDKKFHQGHIPTCCKHKERKTVNNFYWFYKEEFEELLIKFNNNIRAIIEYKLSRY